MQDIRINLLGKAHNPNIDNMSVAQMRVVLEDLQSNYCWDGESEDL